MKEKIERELESALAAQAEGNPGKARVCARRAAGWAIREYYARRDAPVERLPPGRLYWGGDAMAQLKRLREDARVPEPVRTAAARLATKVDFDHQLPFDDDPVEDARGIIAFVQDAA